MMLLDGRDHQVCSASPIRSLHNHLSTITCPAPLCIRGRRHSCIFDSALVIATLDSEVTFLTPIGIPRVGDLPILGTAIYAPTYDLHGMPACHLSSDVVIDAAGIVLKVRVHGESDLHGATSHDSPLDAFLTLRCDSLS